MTSLVENVLFVCVIFSVLLLQWLRKGVFCNPYLLSNSLKGLLETISSVCR